MNARDEQADVIIYRTKDYSRFSFHPLNRPVDGKWVLALAERIKHKNMLGDYPMHVSRNYEVRDGQHRLRAAELLGEPIYYQFTDNVSARDVADVNSARLGWTMQNYLDSHCADGKPDYLKLRGFIEEFPFLKLNQAATLCFYGDRNRGGQFTEKFRAGKFECNDLAFACKVARAVQDFKPHFKHWKHAGFIYAVSNLMANADYRHDVMMQKMEYMSTKLVKCPDMDSYIAVINEIYNYKSRNRVDLKKLESNSRKYRTDRKRPVNDG